MDNLIEKLFTNPQLGLSGVFLALFLLMFYTLRKDTAAHKEDFKEVSTKMFIVLELNTKSNVELSESIRNLRSRIG